MAILGDSSYPGGDGDNIANFGSLKRSQATESGSITDIVNNLGVYSASGTYRPIIYRGTSTAPTTLAYYAGSDVTVTVGGEDTHTLSSPITMTSGEYLWHGIRAILNTGLRYGADAGVDGADISPMNDPPPDPITSPSVFNDTRYASALIYTPSGGGDTTPDNFTFTDVTNATISTQYTSNSITVEGIDTSTSISITGGTYNINGGSYTSTAGSVVDGDVVTVRVTSSGSASTAVNVVLTIGGVSDTYTVTTAASGTSINTYPSTVRSGSTGNTYATTGLSTVTDITIGVLDATSISDTAGDGTHSVPNLIDETVNGLYGTRTVTITGPEGSPTTSTSFLPLSTQNYVTLSGTLNTTDTGVLYNLSPAAVVTDQIVFTTSTVTIDAQGNITTDYEGTQQLWHIQASTGIARSYNLITGPVPEVITDITFYPTVISAGRWSSSEQ